MLFSIYIPTINAVETRLNMFIASMGGLFQLAFLTPCDQAFNPPFLGGKIIELAKFCFKNKDLNQVYRFSVNK